MRISYHERQGIAMEENNNEVFQPTPPRRRRRRSKWQNFKEAYLPAIIAAAALILIIVFIVGSVKRSKAQEDPSSTQDSTISSSEALQMEADSLLSQAAKLASHYDYQAAIDLLDSYSAGVDSNETIKAKHEEYRIAMSQLVDFTDVEQVPVLGFNLLMADLPRSLADETYGSKFNQNYVTTGEFQKILQQLYDNGYVLVGLHDLAQFSTGADGKTVVTKGTLALPQGKKPIVLTQQGANYYTYMVDGDGDGIADPKGAGFASKLIVDSSGKLMNEMVTGDNTTTVGAFDLIPILDEFVSAHPDFSYHGAKAVIALTGYDGLFGYRTDPETATKISQEYYDKDMAAVGTVIQAVRDSGYELACYTYDQVGYSDMSSADIKTDLDLWQKEVTPLLGNVDILVYPDGSDIGGTDPYSGETYDLLAGYGFRYFMGQDNAAKSWGQITDQYARSTRRWVTGSAMAHSPEQFSDLFDASAVLDKEHRGDIPS